MVSILVQQRFQYRSGLFAILGKVVPLFDVRRSFLPRERFCIPCDVGDQIEDVKLIRTVLVETAVTYACKVAAKMRNQFS